MNFTTRYHFVVSMLSMVVSPGSAYAEFVGHRAIYKLSLESSQPSSGIASAAGKLAVDWRDVCDGWTMEFRSFFDVTYSERGSVRLGSNSTSWENDAGAEFRFKSRHTINDKVTENIEGSATILPGKKGQARITGPSGRKIIALPARTLFPVAHSRKLRETAKKNPARTSTLSQTIFDGMDENSVFLTSAIIGKEQVTKNKDDLVPDLRDKKYWSVNMAYFRPGSREAKPFYEYRVRLFDNGISDELRMNFEDFTLRGKIEQLVLAGKAKCETGQE